MLCSLQILQYFSTKAFLRLLSILGMIFHNTDVTVAFHCLERATCCLQRPIRLPNGIISLIFTLMVRFEEMGRRKDYM